MSYCGRHGRDDRAGMHVRQLGLLCHAASQRLYPFFISITRFVMVTRRENSTEWHGYDIVITDMHPLSRIHFRSAHGLVESTSAGERVAGKDCAAAYAQNGGCHP